MQIADGSVMELHQIAQHADDIDRAVAFYTGQLDGELIARYDPPGLAFLRLGPARLVLEKAAPSALIYLRLDDARRSAAGCARRASRSRENLTGSMLMTRACSVSLAGRNG